MNVEIIGYSIYKLEMQKLNIIPTMHSTTNKTIFSSLLNHQIFIVLHFFAKYGVQLVYLMCSWKYAS